MRQWTLAERQRQAELIKSWQPWQHLAGKKTPEGKAISARNAYKGGYRQAIKELRAELRRQDKIVEC